MNVRYRWLAGIAAAILFVVGPASAVLPAQAQDFRAVSSGTEQFDPTPDGVRMPAPFVKMFFGKREALQGGLFVTNGYFESDEMPIMGIDPHAGLDLALVKAPDNGFGRPIYAGGDGRAYRSYQRIPFEWTDPKTGTVHNLSIGGLLAEVRYSSDGGQTPNGWVAQMFHFSAVNTLLPHYEVPEIVKPDAEMWAKGVPVTASTIIGWMGDSGLNKNCEEQVNIVAGTVSRCPSWDRPHLHVQLYQGRGDCTAVCSKRNSVDPGGFWSQVWPGEWTGRQSDVKFNPYTPRPGVVKYGPQTAFLTTNRGEPMFAAP